MSYMRLTALHTAACCNLYSDTQICPFLNGDSIGVANLREVYKVNFSAHPMLQTLLVKDDSQMRTAVR
eukprot:6209261-Pleurochrysis_carterae.AAC.1